MVLKLDSIRGRLAKLEEVVSELERLRETEVPAEGAVAHRWAIERGLHLGAQSLLDAGAHLLSAAFGVAPETYDDIVRQLGERRVLSPSS